MASNPAPGDLEHVRAFVNTWDEDDRTEELSDGAALAGWLREHGLADGRVEARPKDLEHAVALREALRAILLHHGGEELDPAAPEVVEEAARRARLEVRFDGHGHAGVEPLAGGVDGALGRLLALVAEAQRSGEWERLKVCPAHDCHWAFYDRSRNRSAVWCDMRVCGNRAKVRSFRERSQAT